MKLLTYVLAFIILTFLAVAGIVNVMFNIGEKAIRDAKDKLKRQ